MKGAMLFVAGLALAIGYMVWLDAGCGALGGVMTWSGKVCVENL